MMLSTKRPNDFHLSIKSRWTDIAIAWSQEGPTSTSHGSVHVSSKLAGLGGKSEQPAGVHKEGAPHTRPLPEVMRHSERRLARVDGIESHSSGPSHLRIAEWQMAPRSLIH